MFGRTGLRCAVVHRPVWPRAAFVRVGARAGVPQKVKPFVSRKPRAAKSLLTQQQAIGAATSADQSETPAEWRQRSGSVGWSPSCDLGVRLAPNSFQRLARRGGGLFWGRPPPGPSAKAEYRAFSRKTMLSSRRHVYIFGTPGSPGHLDPQLRSFGTPSGSSRTS